MALLAAVAGPIAAEPGDDAPMFALWLWTYASSVLAHAVFLDLPASAGWGGVVMGGASRPAGGRPRAARRRGCRHDLGARCARRRRRGADRAHGRQRRAAAPPADRATTVDERVAVLLPLRDEADRVDAVPDGAARPSAACPGCEIVVLDDGSTDGTADVVRAAVAGDGRSGCSPAPPLPAGLARQAARLPAARRRRQPDARRAGLRGRRRGARARTRSPRPWPCCGGRGDLLSPYPRILTGAGERLVQPLLQWSWLTFLPLRAMERSPRPSLAAAGGQLLVVDRAGYDRAGGHAAVRDEVLEDIALARAVKRTGGRIALADGSRLADCRMYTSWRELVDGYSKSLWASFGSPAGAAAVVARCSSCTPCRRVLAIVAGGHRRRGARRRGRGRVPPRGGRPGRERARDRRPGLAGRARPPGVRSWSSPGWSSRSFRRRRQGRLAWRGR